MTHALTPSFAVDAARQQRRAPFRPGTYLRLVHLLTMFPTGILYFVVFAVLLSAGGVLIWTFVGAGILLLSAFLARSLGRLEASLVTVVTGQAIRRPPEGIEDGMTLRQRVTVRMVDPTTWTSLVYLILQFPFGTAAFVLLVAAYGAGLGLLAGSAIVATGGQYTLIDGEVHLQFDRWFQAPIMAPAGLLLVFLGAHLTLVLSALHTRWAQFMLGSRSRWPSAPSTLRPESPQPTEGPEARSPLAEIADEPSFSELTPRERDVLRLIAAGYSNAEIAEAFMVSEGTVKTHVKRVLEKLGVRDRTQAAVLALKTRGRAQEPGLTDP